VGNRPDRVRRWTSGTILQAYRGGTVQLSANTPTLITLPASTATILVVKDASNNMITSGVPVVYTSSDPYVATVDGSAL